MIRIGRHMGTSRSLLKWPSCIPLLLVLSTAGAVLNIFPSSHRALTGSDVLLPCKVDKTSPNPEPPTVIWFFQDKEIARYDNKGLSLRPRASFNGWAANMGDASLSLANVSISDEGIYRCRVIYQQQQKDTRVILDVLVPPVIFIPNKVISKNKENTVMCMANGFYPEDIDISWYKDNKPLTNSELGKQERNPDGTYRVMGTVTLPPMDGKMDHNFSCRVQHASLQQPLQEDFQLKYKVPPVIFIPNKVISKNKENTVMCMANGFYPEDIDISWYKDNEPLTNSELGKQERNPDGTYRVMGTVTLPPMDGKMDHNFSCRVQHLSLQQPLQEDFQLKYKDEINSNKVVIKSCVFSFVLLAVLSVGAIIWKVLNKTSLQGYTVSEIKGPEKLLDGEETTLYCTVSNCPQEDPQVTWIEERSGDQWEIPQCRDPGEAEQLLGDSYLITCRNEGLQSYCSSLRFVPRVGKHRDVTLICRFVCAEETTEKRFQCRNIYARPARESVVPSLCDSEKISYSLTLQGFYPRDISIHWISGLKYSHSRKIAKEQYTENPDLTFNVRSEIKIPGYRLKDPEFQVGVTWEHGSLDALGYREISAQDPEFPWKPVVDPIQDTKFLHNSPTTLQCNISEYFPDALTVTWLRKEAGSEELTEVPNTHSDMRTCKQADNTYSCTASLTISPKLRDQGAEYICRVIHPSLVKPIDTSTGNINVLGQPDIGEPS
ncbi:uncharacterized protein LOC121397885 [Xenopus laevis]|uniref:Uncharacterized protein LOC121397885 n=1 Tax=Xenopus laevis TaxID=8355 RepID=A0A8J1LS00_XENLA|nr:uncharacterized protein LOC121397885 [Xenopus laevis]